MSPSESPDIQEFGELFDEKGLTNARKNADRQFRDFTTDEWNYIRRRSKSDLFFLANGPLEYTLLSPRLHGDLAAWIMKNRGWQYKQLLLPRDHYKSTICTIADGIQMALPNVADLQEHPYYLGPNIKLLIAHEVRDKAASFLFEISAAFTRKPMMLYFWPECIPTRKEHRINKWELELPRTEHHRDATFSTAGAGSASQGGHFHWLKLDDLVGEEARDSETVMERIRNWFDNVNSLLTRPKLDGWDLIGTRWAFNDVYSHAMERYGIHVDGSVLNCINEKDIVEYGPSGQMKIYGRGMIEEGELIFPEENSWEFVNILRKNPIVWAAQYANNPMESGLQEFPWPLKFYNVSTSQPDVLIVFSPEGSFKRRIEELDIVILVDPSMGETEKADHTGIIVAGVDFRGNIFVLETVKERINPAKIMDTFYRLYFKYKPRAIAIEEVNFSAIFRYWIQDRATLTGIGLPVVAYKPGSKRTKDARIRGLSHFFAAGQVYVSEGMHQLRDEYEQFPLGKSKHLLDAFAQGPEIWQRGNTSQGDIDSVEKKMEEVIQQRSVHTGY